MLATGDEVLVKDKIAMEGAIVAVLNVGLGGRTSTENRDISELGLGRRTNFYVGVIVLASVVTAAILAFKVIFWVP